jgi:hypothetical protein
MGHLRLDRLPRTHRWKKVIEALANGDPVEKVAETTYWAADTGLAKVPQDVGFTQTLTVIFGFVNAIQSKNPDAALRKAGFEVPDGASVFDYINSFKEKASAAAVRERARSDIAEIAQDSFAKVLVKTAGAASPSLFGDDSAQTRTALHENLKASAIGGTMHEFFASFTSQYLNYYLGRETPYHVGPGRTFANLQEHSQFARDFDLSIRQTVRIADEFTSGWLGKAQWEGRLSPDDVSKYAHVAFKKIRSEFKRSVKGNG